MAENKKLRGNRIELPDGDYFYAPDTMATSVIGLTDIVDNRVADLGGITSQEEVDSLKEKLQEVLDAGYEEDIIAIQNDLLTKGTDIDELSTRVTNNETVIEDIGSDIDSIDEDIDAIEKDIATIKTDFMETDDYLVDGQFEGFRLPIWSDENFNKIDPSLYDNGTNIDEVQSMINTSISGLATETYVDTKNQVFTNYATSNDLVVADLKAQITALQSGATSIVDLNDRSELPTSNQNPNIIYWIPTSTQYVYEQTRWSDTLNDWIDLGTTEAALTEYIKTADAVALINASETTLNDKIDNLELGTDIDAVNALIDAKTASLATYDSVTELRTYVDNLPTGTDEDKVNELINDKIENVAYTDEENIFTEEQKFEAGLKVIAETGICIEADGTDKCTTIVGYDDGDNGIKSEIVMGGDFNFNTNGYTVLINDVEIGRGEDGEDGDDAYEIAVAEGYVGSRIEWIASLKGDTGETGEQGIQGLQGVTGEQGLQGPEGPQGPQGIAGENGEDGTALKVSFKVDTYDELLTKTGYVYNNEIALCSDDEQYYTYVENASNGNQYEWTILPNVGTGVQGIQGEPGIQGPQGEQGPTGPQGEQGIQGIQGVAGNDGERGASAYEIAVSNGWQTTEELWLESLNGSTGPQGIQGLQGQQGIQGVVGPEGPSGVVTGMATEYEMLYSGSIGSLAVDAYKTVTISGINLYEYTDFRCGGSTWGQGKVIVTGENTVQVYNNTTWVSSLSGIYARKMNGQITDATGLVGPQGIQGIQGVQGVDGPQGPAGNDGQDGFVNEAMYWDLIKRLEALENK